MPQPIYFPVEGAKIPFAVVVGGEYLYSNGSPYTCTRIWASGTLTHPPPPRPRSFDFNFAGMMTIACNALDRLCCCCSKRRGRAPLKRRGKSLKETPVKAGLPLSVKVGLPLSLHALARLVGSSGLRGEGSILFLVSLEALCF